MGESLKCPMFKNACGFGVFNNVEVSTIYTLDCVLACGAVARHMACLEQISRLHTSMLQHKVRSLPPTSLINHVYPTHPRHMNHINIACIFHQCCAQLIHTNSWSARVCTVYARNCTLRVLPLSSSKKYDLHVDNHHYEYNEQGTVAAYNRQAFKVSPSQLQTMLPLCHVARINIDIHLDTSKICTKAVE